MCAKFQLLQTATVISYFVVKFVPVMFLLQFFVWFRCEGNHSKTIAFNFLFGCRRAGDRLPGHGGVAAALHRALNVESAQPGALPSVSVSFLVGFVFCVVVVVCFLMGLFCSVLP